jgi:hypothetical protein
MAENFLLQGTVKWSYDHEMAAFSQTRKIVAGMTGLTSSLYSHEGLIALSRAELIIEGINNDEDLTIPLGNMKQIYLGFDELFPMIAVKSLGMLWQPLRIEYYISSFQTQFIYLVINFNGVFTHDKEWFNALTELLQ